VYNLTSCTLQKSPKLKLRFPWEGKNYYSHYSKGHLWAPSECSSFLRRFFFPLCAERRSVCSLSPTNLLLDRQCNNRHLFRLLNYTWIPLHGISPSFLKILKTNNNGRIHPNGVHVPGCIQKFPDWVDNEINNNSSNKHSLRSNTNGYGGKTHKTDSHKIALQLRLLAESCTTCSSGSRWPIQKLLDTLTDTPDVLCDIFHPSLALMLT
jgi:hypothetical protein